MRLPAILTAGDSATWLDDPTVDARCRNINSAGYTLTYSLRGPIAAAGLDLVATTNGSGWSTSITSVQTAALNVGSVFNTWFWQAFYGGTGERLTAGSGTLKVQPNFAALTGQAVDGRSQNEQILIAIRAEIQARQTGGFTTEYTIGSRSLKKEPIGQLLAMETAYMWKVARERRAQNAANGLGKPGQLGVRFV